MPIRLSFLCSLFGVFVFAQKPNSQDKAYLANDTIIVLGDDYMLKSTLENPNDFTVSYPKTVGNKPLISLSLLFKDSDYVFIDSKDNAVYRLKKDSLILWIPSESVPSIGATHIVKNDTIFR